MQDGSCVITHFIKFVDTADPIVTQHQCSPTYVTGGNLSDQPDNDISLLTSLSYKAVMTYVCSTSCLVSGSLVTYAVKPTALDPFPEVYWPRGIRLCTYWNENIGMGLKWGIWE